MPARSQKDSIQAALSGLDLNLLLTLDLLLEIRNVTATAERVGVTQSAVSHRLSRLREFFDDPLLVAAGDDYVLSSKAEALRTPLRAALEELRTALLPSREFDPAEAERTFVIGASDLAEVTMLPLLLAPPRQRGARYLDSHARPRLRDRRSAHRRQRRLRGRSWRRLRARCQYRRHTRNPAAPPRRRGLLGARAQGPPSASRQADPQAVPRRDPRPGCTERVSGGAGRRDPRQVGQAQTRRRTGRQLPQRALSRREHRPPVDVSDEPGGDDLQALGSNGISAPHRAPGDPALSSIGTTACTTTQGTGGSVKRSSPSSRRRADWAHEWDSW